jgi:hypothetical protein
MSRFPAIETVKQPTAGHDLDRRESTHSRHSHLRPKGARLAESGMTGLERLDGETSQSLMIAAVDAC